VNTDDEVRLIEKLQKIEMLFARSSFPGEQAAAESAADRIRQRIRQLEKAEATIEWRFSLPDTWSKALFIALLRRYNLRPYRYRGQRRTTVMVKVTASFVNESLWPEFQELNATLRAHLDSVTNDIIKRAIHASDAEVEERTEQEADASGGQGALSLG
jgi:hypothetical protein